MAEHTDDSDPGGTPKPPGRDARRPTPVAGRPSLRSPNEALQPVPAPPPPKPVKRKRRPVIATASGLLSFVGIAAIACVLAWSVGMQRINAVGPLTSDKVVTVRPGNDVSVVDQLSDEGVIDNRTLMTATLWLEGDRGEIKSGEYMFKQGASLREVIDTLVSGKQILHAITIPEGLTSEQVVDRLKENDVLLGDIATVPGEGTLMPDTYKFARGTTRDQVIRSMQAEQKKVLADVWAHRSPETPIRSPFELVTLASIVEKETGRADERPRVAGVFVNRLAHNMPLQSDPTIVYGLVGGKGTLGRGILKSEIEQKTPYNTYTNPGLPPGPIANPGKAALEAVANPSRTKDLYFVADGTGGHAFSDNLDQHRLNVLRWRQIEKDKLGPDTDKSSTPVTGGSAAPPRADQHGALDADIDKYADLTGDPGDVPSAQAAAVPLRQPDAPAQAAAQPAGPAMATTAGVPANAGAPASAALAAALPTFAQPNMPMQIARPAGVFDPVSGKLAGAPGKAAAGATRTADATGATFDELDVDVGGLKSRSDPAAWDDGEGYDPGTPATGEAAGNGTMQTFPVPPQHLAEQRARAIALGLLPANAALPDPASEAPPADGEATTTIHRLGKGKIIDASEGTAFDPLLDKTYDLSSAKVVPVIKALPPLVPLASSSR